MKKMCEKFSNWNYVVVVENDDNDFSHVSSSSSSSSLFVLIKNGKEYFDEIKKGKKEGCFHFDEICYNKNCFSYQLLEHSSLKYCPVYEILYILPQVCLTTNK